MKTAERGAGSGEVFVIIAFVVYFLFMGYLGKAAGYTAHIPGGLGSWQIPFVDVGGHWYSMFTGTLDVLIAVVNVFGWVLGALVSYVALIGFSVTGGDMPMWITAFLFTPLALGMGWLILSLVRGR
jgi:hypothetical protein